ncbi:MAG: hypothetical protein K1X92_17315, partial [Bacteroidia bacterium]|nr:hypothetical protein [Bacteroidia bacterium]
MIIRQLKWIISLILILNLSTSFSQQLIDKNTEAYLNLYVDYINANIHGVKSYHKKFEQFNQSINKYYAEAPLDKEGRMAYETKKGVMIKFESPTVMQDPSAFTVLPADLYQQIQSFYPSQLSPEQIALLQSRVSETHAIAGEIMNISANLESYCLEGTYLEDMPLEVAYKFLNRAEILLHDFSESKDLLYYEIRRIQNQFLPQNLNNPYVRSYNKLLTFVLYARNTLIAMKKEDKNSVFEQLPLMETALADLRQNQAAYLAGITSTEVINQY